MKHAAKFLLQALSRQIIRWRGAFPQVPLQGWLRHTARRWLRTLGIPGMLALGVLAGLPFFYLSAIAPVQERLDIARRGTFLLNEQMLQAGKTPFSGHQTPAGQLAEFYQIFPGERSSPLWLGKLAVLAKKNGLSLNEGEYKATRDKVGRLVRFQMTLPVKGEYSQIRRFLSALPAETPVIALENVQFARQNIADSTVEAQIRLALYLEQAS
jgi:hypothetical protein